MLELRHLRAAMRLEGFDGRAAQRLVEPADRGPVPPGSTSLDVRPAAALLYVHERPEGSPGRPVLRFPLEIRPEHLATHPGQPALPGGRPEPGEDLATAAWREAGEEIGLARAPEAEDLGTLHPVYIPITHTGLVVHVACGPPPPAWVASPAEVAAVALPALDELLDPAIRVVLPLVLRGVEREVPHLLLGGARVWGATAMALSELAERLRVVLATEAREAAP